jgi:formamidopyrimidine-DNA glycosylase
LPELPELQAHAERLDATFTGAVLERFSPLSFTVMKTADPPPAVTEGHAVVWIGRRGKHLLIDMGVATYVVHLMQGGRLRVDEKQAAKPRGGQARWSFADGRALLLTEPGTERKAGVWLVTGDPEDQEPLAGLGPDADLLDDATLAQLLADRSQRLHGFLRDQRAVAGVGRRLANEVCHRAKLSPFATTSALTAEEVARLGEAIRSTIAEGLAHERGLTDMGASADRPGNVHHRVGEPCPVCGDEVRAVEYRAYTVAYCPSCQTGGKVLADNTTSKFLK